MEFSTKVLHGKSVRRFQDGATLPPITQVSAFSYESAEALEKVFANRAPGFAYTRIGNPTVDAFEKRICELEGGLAATACSSGMAAITAALLNILQSGDEIIAGSGLFGGTIDLLGDLAAYGIKTRFVKHVSAAAVKTLICDKTKVIFGEIIGNPGLDIMDISNVAELAHAHQIPLIVDATTVTPYLISPLKYGADIVIHSASKYINGSGNSVSGVIVDGGKFNWDFDKHASLAKYKKFGNFAFSAGLRNDIWRNVGGCLSPMNAYLNMLGLETLGLRMQRICDNALALAKALEKIDGICVNYPGLESNPYYSLVQKQFGGKGGGIITLRAGSKIRAYKLINALKYALNATNIGDTKTLVIHPASTIYMHSSEEQKIKGVFKDTKGDTTADYDTYNTIMKDKEWLLSYDCPLRFIFSHSALKEGWDNPNVFQICTLIDQKNTFTCRQKVGRGLRLCVDQTGERIEDKNINILHVMANESFAEFAETLQKEIETETGVKFGTLQISLFSGLTYTETKTVEKTITKEQAQTVVEALKTSGAVTSDGKVNVEKVATEVIVPKELEAVKEEVIKVIEKSETVDVEEIAGTSYTEEVEEEKTVTYDDAKELITHFEDKGYVSKSGKIKDTMKEALLNGTLDLPKKFEAARERLESIVKKADSRVPIRDDSKEVIVRLNKQVMLSPEFMELWGKIKQKTAYRVVIDTPKLVENCVKELKAMPQIPKARLIQKTADIDIQNAGVNYRETEFRTTDLEDTYTSLPYILGIISEETLIKKSTVAEIIMKSGRAQDFLNNPQTFMEQCLKIIKNNRHALAILRILHLSVLLFVFGTLLGFW